MEFRPEFKNVQRTLEIHRNFRYSDGIFSEPIGPSFNYAETTSTKALIILIYKHNWNLEKLQDKKNV